MKMKTMNTMTRLDETIVSNRVEMCCTEIGNRMPKPANRTASTRTHESSNCD